MSEEPMTRELVKTRDLRVKACNLINSSTEFMLVAVRPAGGATEVTTMIAVDDSNLENLKGHCEVTIQEAMDKRPTHFVPGEN